MGPVKAQARAVRIGRVLALMLIAGAIGVAAGTRYVIHLEVCAPDPEPILYSMNDVDGDSAP